MLMNDNKKQVIIFSWQYVTLKSRPIQFTRIDNQ